MNACAFVPGRDVRLPLAFSLAVRRWDGRFSRHALLVNIARQRMWLLAADPARRGSDQQWPDYEPVRRYVVSTSRYGIGQVADSNHTPLGLHRIARKVGAGWPIGTVFKSRQVVGATWAGLPDAPIRHRIFWLEGLEPGFNRSGNVDTFARYIYIHGCGNELTLGRPDSHGCVHVAGADLLPLFDKLPEGTLVWIARD